MALHPIIQRFYASDTWRGFRANLILTRGNTCEHCGNIIAEASNITIHHKEPLTPENVDDALVSLNPDNCLIVHGHPCHDEIEKRFGFADRKKKVFIVYGPPRAGKTTYVLKYRGRQDLIVDMDSLYEAVTLLPRYDKPNALYRNVLALRDTLLDNIKTRTGYWRNAWIVGGYADKYQREWVRQDTGAELIFINTPKEVCLERAAADGLDKTYNKFIDEWFERYVE